MLYISQTVFKDNLYHHGIKGQKWNVQNGPPYPLDKEQLSTLEKRGVQSKTHKLTKKQKAIITGVAIGCLAAGIGYTAYKTGTFQSLAKSYDLSQKVSSKNVNPKYSMFDLGTSMNCGNCALAAELRSRGMDIQANSNEKGMTKSTLLSCFKGLTDDNFNRMDTINPAINRPGTIKQKGKTVFNDISKSMLSKYPDGSRGTIFVPTDFGSHWMYWSINGNKLKIYNPQNDKLDLFSFLGHYYNKNTSHNAYVLESIRLDNLELNTQQLDKFVSKRGQNNSTKLEDI